MLLPEPDDGRATATELYLNAWMTWFDPPAQWRPLPLPSSTCALPRRHDRNGPNLVARAPPVTLGYATRRARHSGCLLASCDVHASNGLSFILETVVRGSEKE